MVIIAAPPVKTLKPRIIGIGGRLPLTDLAHHQCRHIHIIIVVFKTLDDHIGHSAHDVSYNRLSQFDLDDKTWAEGRTQRELISASDAGVEFGSVRREFASGDHNIRDDNVTAAQAPLPAISHLFIAMTRLCLPPHNLHPHCVSSRSSCALLFS